MLGVDVLSDYEVDLDQPGGKLTLRSAEGCTADDSPWPGRGSWPLPAAFTTHGRVLVPLHLGDVPVQAMLDTGVDHSVLDAETARRAGVTTAQLGSGTPSSFLGAALQPVTMREVSLPDVRIGPERFKAVPVEVPDMPLPGMNMLLGNDYLSRRQVLISWRRRAVFVRSGG